MGGSGSKTKPRKPNDHMVDISQEFVNKNVRLRCIPNDHYITVASGRDGLTTTQSNSDDNAVFTVVPADSGKVGFMSVAVSGRYIGANSDELKLRPHLQSLENWQIYRKDCTCCGGQSYNVCAIYCGNEGTDFRWISAGKSDLIHDWASSHEEFEIVVAEEKPKLEGVMQTRHVVWTHVNKGSKPDTRTVRYTVGVKNTKTNTWNVEHTTGYQFKHSVSMGHFSVHTAEHTFSQQFTHSHGGSTAAETSRHEENQIEVVVPPGKRVTLYQLVFRHDRSGLEMRCENTLREEEDA